MHLASHMLVKRERSGTYEIGSHPVCCRIHVSQYIPSVSGLCCIACIQACGCVQVSSVDANGAIEASNIVCWCTNPQLVQAPWKELYYKRGVNLNPPELIIINNFLL